MQEIKVLIKPDGQIELECNGFEGTACDITKVAEEALGKINRKDKDEFYKNVLNIQQTNTLGE